MSVDRVRGELYVKSGSQRWYRIDERTGAIKDVGIPLVKKYQEEVAPGVQPILVEHRFELALPEKVEVGFCGK